MRPIEVKRTSSGGVEISVGVVDQEGKYQVLRLTAAEAGVLSVKLPEKI